MRPRPCACSRVRRCTRRSARDARGPRGTGVGAPRSRATRASETSVVTTERGALEVAATPVPRGPRLGGVLTAVALALACASPAVARGLDGRALRVVDGRLVDKGGREI